MTLNEYNRLIERFDKAFAADKWFQIDHFKVLYDELVEKRDAAMKASMGDLAQRQSAGGTTKTGTRVVGSTPTVPPEASKIAPDEQIIRFNSPRKRISSRV